MASGPPSSSSPPSSPSGTEGTCMRTSSESLYAPSASHTTSPARPRASRQLHDEEGEEVSNSYVDGRPAEEDEPRPKTKLADVLHDAHADPVDGKSQQQREKEEGEGQETPSAVLPAYLIPSRGQLQLQQLHKLKGSATPESAVLQLHLSRGSPLPTRRRTSSSSPHSSSSSSSSPSSTYGEVVVEGTTGAEAGGSQRAARLTASSHHHLHLQQVAHFNSHLQAAAGAAAAGDHQRPDLFQPSPPTSPSLTTMEELKHRQHAQFLALARVMKGDSFDSIESFENGISPPTSPRFLSVSTGSGLVSTARQQKGSRGRPPYSPSHFYRNSSSSSSSFATRWASFFREMTTVQRTLLLTALFATIFMLLLLILQPALFLTYTNDASSSGGLLKGYSFNLVLGSRGLPRAPSPDEMDNSWFNERDRLRGRAPTFRDAYQEVTYTMHQLVGDEEGPLDAEVDESYKYRDYPFLLHNALPRVAKDKTVVMVIANSGYLEMLLNWKAYVDNLNITNYIIIPVDVQMAQQLSFLGVDWAFDPEIGLDAAAESVAFTTNKKNANYAKWNKVVHKKSHYFRKILELGYNVMVSDIDMVWMRNPFTAMTDNSVDLYFINDWDKPAGHKTPLICGGLYYAKSNKKSLAFIDHVIDCEENLDKKEQYCLNMWYEALIGAPKKGNEISIPSSEKPNYEVMDPNEFPSGGYYFSRAYHRKTEKPNPFIIHNNWIVGKMRKLDRFRAFGLWFVNEDSLFTLMKDFRFDEPKTPHGRGHEGEISDELMIYYTEMRNRYGKFDESMWRLPAPLEATVKLPTPQSDVARESKADQAQPKPKKANKAAPTRGVPRNPNYKHVDGAVNPHYRH